MQCTIFTSFFNSDPPSVSIIETPLQADGNYYLSSLERSLECLVLNGKNGSRANFVSRVQKMISVETCFPPFPVSEQKQFRGF